MSEFAKLKDLCLKIGSGATPRGGNNVYLDKGNYTLIRSQNIYNEGFSEHGIVYISDSDAKKLDNVSVEENDVLINITGDSVARVTLPDNRYLPARVNQHVAILRANPEKLDFQFLKYSLIEKSMQEYLLTLASSGATRNALTKGMLENIEIKLPSLDEQKRVSGLLSKFDQKIQLNTQINQTLEQIAQALFKSWFVDFDPVRAKVQALSDGLSLEQAELAAMQAISGKTPEELTALSQTQPERYAELAETAKAFPCEMVEVDGVEVPKGWELSTIGDCYDVVMGQSPKGETYNENKQGMLFYQGRAEFGWRFPTPRLFTTDPKRIAEQNSILMSVRAPVGDINIALEKCCIGRGLAALQHKSKSLSFGLYQIQSIKSELDLFNGEGTVFGSINQANLKNIQIINPDEKFIQLFEKYLSSCDSKIMNNEIENNALKEIRDLLLPRLLSGDFND